MVQKRASNLPNAIKHKRDFIIKIDSLSQRQTFTPNKLKEQQDTDNLTTTIKKERERTVSQKNSLLKQSRNYSRLSNHTEFRYSPINANKDLKLREMTQE